MNSYFKALNDATDDGKHMELQSFWRMYHKGSRMFDTDGMQRIDKVDILNSMKLPNSFKSHQ